MKSGIITAATSALLFSGVATAAEIKVLSTQATEQAYRELMPQFEQASGHKVTTIFTGTLDASRAPASYRSLITGGFVHYFDCAWGQEHHKATPRTFGTTRSELWRLLEAGHHGVSLSTEEVRRVKCWIDLNCPLWPDYRYRLDRPATAAPRRR